MMTRPSALHIVRMIDGHRRSPAFLVAGATAVLVAAWMTSAPAPPTASERSGIDQLHIRRTAGGNLLDMRYRVVDSELATSLLAKKTTAYVVDEKSGRRLPVPTTPKAGSLRTTGVPRAGRSYFALFTNPGGLVHRGDQVSVVLGDLSTRLTVE
jgi:hypothetical protein